ncbi:MAG: O-antigen polymerase [Nocardioides sp.]|uniref:O-antigen polymerase n=1 Tax=Nocardioides sp. TaxID=35761 RepID=UPI0039E3B09B
MSAILVFTRPSRCLAHPAVLYLLFHVYVVTLRGWAILSGSETFLGIGMDAVARAVIVADVFLVSATLGWLLAENRRPVTLDSPARVAVVERATVRRIGLFAVPIGLISLVTYGFVPGVAQGDTVVTTSYQTVAILWPALILIALIYVRGFKPTLLVLLATFLAVMALQGHSRFRFAIPLIMLLLIYLWQRGRRWPPLRLWVPVLILMALFVPLKAIGSQVRSGDASWESIRGSVEESTSEVVRGDNPEQALLDQAAISISLADEKALTFHGRPYLAVLTLPVPRPLWPNKPGLANHLQDLESPAYPIAEIGAITTVAGDLYINFRWVGVIVGGLALAFVTGNLFRTAMATSERSAYFFGYCLLAGAIVQIARDGLTSVFVFTVVNATPWVLIWYLSIRQQRIRERRSNVRVRRYA